MTTLARPQFLAADINSCSSMQHAKFCVSSGTALLMGGPVIADEEAATLDGRPAVDVCVADSGLC